MPIDLNELFARHQIALIKESSDPDAEARRWAGLCADYYAARIVAHREQRGFPAWPV
jgi:hypothetical protein